MNSIYATLDIAKLASFLDIVRIGLLISVQWGLSVLRSCVFNLLSSSSCFVQFCFLPRSLPIAPAPLLFCCTQSDPVPFVKQHGWIVDAATGLATAPVIPDNSARTKKVAEERAIKIGDLIALSR